MHTHAGWHGGEPTPPLHAEQPPGFDIHVLRRRVGIDGQDTKDMLHVVQVPESEDTVLDYAAKFGRVAILTLLCERMVPSVEPSVRLIN